STPPFSRHLGLLRTRVSTVFFELASALCSSNSAPPTSSPNSAPSLSYPILAQPSLTSSSHGTVFVQPRSLLD
ncbi:hypothetical protein A2U01_0088198, partial [Trifolium medium]|nr:hypothetical protein [Trifolium medium]